MSLEEKQQVITITPEGMEWEMVVPISGHLDGNIEDWPSHIKEPILEELQKTVAAAHESGELQTWINTAEVIDSYCDFDVDENVHFLRIIAAARSWRADGKTILKSGKLIH